MNAPAMAMSCRLAITAQALAHGGGAERYARDVTAGLLDLGLRPWIIARKIDPDLPEAQNARCTRLPLRGVPKLLRSRAFDALTAWVLRRSPVDCVFGINHTLHADVVVCGGTHPGFLQAMGKTAGWADRAQIALERRTYIRARTIVAHSVLMRDELTRFYPGIAEKISVLYPPVDPRRFTPMNASQRLQARLRLGLPTDRPVFLLASTGHARKGLGELAPLFSQTDAFGVLAVAGRPLPEKTRNVIELGYRPDIEAVYAAADYTVVASLYEPFGLVAVESVLCGTPVVIADNVGSAEVISEEAKIAYDRNDANALAQALQSAAGRARQGRHRLIEPRQYLRYDPAVSTHVRALLSLFQRCCDDVSAV